jgi:thiosulfate/3-mercaptopyruvate sulfurtransferase
VLPPVVGGRWLAEHLEQVAVCDVRTTMSGARPADRHREGHLPGARLVDLDTDLADPPDGSAGRHPLPAPERFAEVMARVGVGPDMPVVAYDDAHGGFAARLVWMLRILGQPAALLDGGLVAWEGPLDTGPVPTVTVERPVIPWPADALADADTVAAHIAEGGVVIDSREAARYRGEIEPIDAVAGHVPGAVSRPFAGNLDDRGRFLPAAALAERFAAVGDGPWAIVYCGSGVTACHNALAIERAGLPRPRVYVGSWSGWSADPERPVATGDADPPPGSRAATRIRRTSSGSPVRPSTTSGSTSSPESRS